MKLLYVKASGFKNIQNDCVLDFTAKSKKTTEDKEYELQEIADGLFVYNTVAFIGKNASGKTSFLDLLDCAYSISPLAVTFVKSLNVLSSLSNCSLNSLT